MMLPYFHLLITPFIRAVMSSTNRGSVGRLFFIKTACVSITVAIALRPAAFMVSPDSVTTLAHCGRSVPGSGVQTHLQDRQSHRRHLRRKRPQHYPRRILFSFSV